MTQKEKTKFRSTSKWKKFRNYMKKVQGGKDAITNKPLYRGWNLHHLDESRYTDLSEEKFMCLNKQTHEVLHWLERYDDFERIALLLVETVKVMRKYKENNLKEEVNK